MNDRNAAQSSFQGRQISYLKREIIDLSFEFRKMQSMSKRRDTTISPAVIPDRRFSIGPEDVLRLKKPTNGFLCSLSDEHNIEFLKFTISDEDSKRVLFEVGQNVEMVGSMEIDYDTVDEDDYVRAVKYSFCEDVLRLPLVSTRCVQLPG
jgi:hypothetical protein